MGIKMVKKYRYIVKKKLVIAYRRVLFFVKWLAIAAIIGIAAGFAGTVFSYGLVLATDLRTEYPQMIIGLPLAGVLIVWLYHTAGRDDDKGTNLVLSSIRSGESMPFTVAPLIVTSTVLTHMFGGSSGREGAALQMGGSIASGLGRLLHMDRKETNAVIMCGMSAGFSAMFGTPVAAAVFSIEVVSVGIMYYYALVPCVFSGLIACHLARLLGVQSETMHILNIPSASWGSLLAIVVLAVLCAALSELFCISMQKMAALEKKLIKNPYLRAAAGGIVIILLTLLLGTEDYLGSGMNIIERSVNGQVKPEAFVLKILFTAITLGAGFKGGEIVPTFFVGATFGCLAGQIAGFSPSLCAAVGLVSVFCGVTNSPIASLLMGIELFGTDAMYYFMAAVAVSYLLSGNYSLYRSQKILYPKYKARNLEGEVKKRNVGRF